MHDDAVEHAETLTTLAAAAGALGVEPGAPPVYPPATPLEPDAPLVVDDDAAHVLAAWFDLGWSVVGALDAPVTLWPEHFDVACSQGDEAAGQGGTFGASPGDAEHPEPYLYVTHWADVADDPYWNDDRVRGREPRLPRGRRRARPVRGRGRVLRRWLQVAHAGVSHVDAVAVASIESHE